MGNMKAVLPENAPVEAIQRGAFPQFSAEGTGHTICQIDASRKTGWFAPSFSDAVNSVQGQCSGRGKMH
jgi:hypothetical protein